MTAVDNILWLWS